MSSETFPKEFEKVTEVLPFTNYGLSSIQEYKEAEKDLQELEWLKKAGLTQDEIQFLKENQAGLLCNRKNMESNAMNEKLNEIHRKLKMQKRDVVEGSEDEDNQASTSKSNAGLDFNILQKKTFTFYPEGHPMNSIKELEQNLFGHLKDDVMPINKRRKVLRRLERKKDKILAPENHIKIDTVTTTCKVDRPGSLWDLKEMSEKQPQEITNKKPVIGPKLPTMYTIKDSKIVRLEPVNSNRKEYKAVDIVMPVNEAEVNLLEGTKMPVDDIRKIDRFKDYKPGIPSKTLYLKNIAPSVSQERVSLLFNQFTLANGGPIDVRLMSGKMRGQAFITFQTEDLAIQALEDINGTIMSGRPIIAQFGRSTNRIDDNR